MLMIIFNIDEHSPFDEMLRNGHAVE